MTVLEINAVKLVTHAIMEHIRRTGEDGSAMLYLSFVGSIKPVPPDDPDEYHDCDDPGEWDDFRADTDIAKEVLGILQREYYTASESAFNGFFASLKKPGEETVVHRPTTSPVRGTPIGYNPTDEEKAAAREHQQAAEEQRRASEERRDRDDCFEEG